MKKATEVASDPLLHHSRLGLAIRPRNIETLPLQCRPYLRSPREVETSDEYTFTSTVTVFTVNGQNDAGVSEKLEAHRLVEARARDVKGSVSRRLQPLKPVKDNASPAMAPAISEPGSIPPPCGATMANAGLARRTVTR
jgi:hypothetical protein